MENFIVSKSIGNLGNMSLKDNYLGAARGAKAVVYVGKTTEVSTFIYRSVHT